MSESVQTAVLIVDDHAAIRMGLKMILEGYPEFSVVGEASDGQTALSMVSALKPDIVLMDVRMPVMDGVEATGVLTSKGDQNVVVITTFDHDEYLFGALAAGAKGFILKTAAPEQIVSTLRSVMAGDQVISPEVTARVVAAALDDGGRRQGSVEGASQASTGGLLAPLTEREREVLILIGRGHSNKEIARELTLAQTTIKTHVSNVLAKLGLVSRVQAAIFCTEHHLV